MGMDVTATCLHWSQSVVSQSPSSQTVASAISSPSFMTRTRCLSNQALACRLINRWNRSSAVLGHSSTTTTRLFRSPSSSNPKFRRQQPLRRAFSASLDGFSEEEFAEQLQELALKFDQMDDDDDNDFEFDKTIKQNDTTDGEQQPENFNNATNEHYVQNPTRTSFAASKIDSVEPPWVSVRPEPPDWPESDEIIPSSIERKANSVDLPFSLRIIKKKNQWQEGFREAGESAYCSVKKAFSSMVFIIRELHSYTLQMREILFYEDLQGILARVQKEMHASFVWLFSQIFSHTPTLMVYVMILLANFTVHSMAHNIAIAATPTDSFMATTTTETISVAENRNHQKPKIDTSAIRTFSVSSTSSGKTNSVGGSNGGGGKVRLTSSGTDGGDGHFDGVSSFNHHQIMPDEVSHQLSSVGNPASKGTEMREDEDEVRLWNSIVEEASKMQAVFMDESLDQETMQGFVSPVTVEIEAEDYQDYFRTELMYQQAVSQDPYNPLLLGNFAQFLYLVVHDHDRADEYFKRAIEVKPADAEVLSLYAHFLWRAKNDLEAAEETFLEAIEADPGNTYYAAKYANFLWNTGGEDTCFPIS